MLSARNKIMLSVGALIAVTGSVMGVRNYVVKPATAETVAQEVAAPLRQVSISIADVSQVRIWNDFSARLEAVDFVEIKPQVDGTITDVKVTDGQRVEKGDVLFVIDPRPYIADVNQAKAELQAARSSVIYSQKELKRAAGLVKRKNISERVYDERANTLAVAKAELEGAKARLMQAEVNLDHAYVKAPISGRISRAEITLGNTVSAGASAPTLTSIVSDAGVYADFEVDESTYLKFIRPVARDIVKERSIPVKLTLRNDSKEFSGFIHSFDNRLDVSSGTIRARAFFANLNNDLLPGMFGTVQLGSARDQQNILIGEKAIGTNQDRKFVYVLDGADIVTYREVKLGERVGGQRVILSGLKVGDRVINEGTITLRPGMKVAPKTAAKVASSS
ncbi:MAG: efflux RND transporter periplasmic adaptor subunit [Sneathiellales bacterium]|nr:efflux RND transporter periplasmic adaptor subunit [Sneathiellales bacterium]